MAIKIDKKVATVEVTFTKRNASDSQIKVIIPVVDNIFISYPTQDFFESELSREWKISAKAFMRKEISRILSNVITGEEAVPV